MIDVKATIVALRAELQRQRAKTVTCPAQAARRKRRLDEIELSFSEMAEFMDDPEMVDLYVNYIADRLYVKVVE